MYFLDIVTYIQKSPCSKPVSVGIDVHSLDWTELYMRLNKHNASVLSGDFSNYDGNLPKELGDKVLEFINDWYDDGEVNRNVRKLLFEHIFHSYHILYDIVYRLAKGNPSGNPLTAIYNSLCNMIILFIVLTYDFQHKVTDYEIAVYGDDNIITTNDIRVTIDSVAECIQKRFLMEYTHCSKKVFTGRDTLDTITYLGRKFVKEDSLYRAPLDMRTIIECTYWCRSEMRNAVLLSTVQSYAIEMSHHGKEVFYERTDKLRRAVMEHAPDLIDHLDIKPYSYYWMGMYDPLMRVYFCSYAGIARPIPKGGTFVVAPQSSDFKM